MEYSNLKNYQLDEENNAVKALIDNKVLAKKQKTSWKLSRRRLLLLVAGHGFEPWTFGL